MDTLSESTVSSAPIQDFSLWEKMKSKRALMGFGMEVTARCNNNCRHCYINLPAGDKTAKEDELSLEEIKGIVDEAASLGAIWCLVTGGEPLLRRDFPEIYLYLKKKGFLVQLFTNAALVIEDHIKLFRKYPPRDVEVSVYGATKETYERVTRKPGSFDAFMRGLNLLLDGGIKVRFKAMAIRSTLHEMPEIARFCWERTKDYFRFDPLIHLRFDGDPKRNEEIKSERLSATEIVELERSDPDRFQEMQELCDRLIVPDFSRTDTNHLFLCSAGKNSFNLSYNGLFRLCSSLWHPSCVYDLRKGSLTDAWNNFVPKVRDMRSDRREFLDTCRVCPLKNLCLWCPAHAWLETGEMDVSVDYFCEVARTRAKALKESMSSGDTPR